MAKILLSRRCNISRSSAILAVASKASKSLQAIYVNKSLLWRLFVIPVTPIEIENYKDLHCWPTL
jgi:hypothetical protein